MSNVIALNPPHRRLDHDTRLAAVLDCFAHGRRDKDNVFWSKENAELLNVLETSGQRVGSAALETYAEYYQDLQSKLEFFPQYYRFLFSIALDLEALGLGGDQAKKMGQWIVDHDLVQSELSDLQRAEACRLLARVGAAPVIDPGLNDRLHRFINHSPTFALPNKKAAYELTHIIFYLSEYGRHDPHVSDRAVESLHYVGILAMLEKNADLLAEVCISLKFAGAVVPQEWQDWIVAHRASAIWSECPDAMDDYHEYFMCDWYTQLQGGPAFHGFNSFENVAVHTTRYQTSPLRTLSETLLGIDRRYADDHKLQRMTVDLPDDVYDAVSFAEKSSPYFGSFFANFARTDFSVQFN